MPTYEHPIKSFVDPFLESAGKVYIAAEEIKARKQEQKKMEDKLQYDLKKAKDDEERRIAEMLFNQILKERQAKEAAERPPKETIQRIVYGMPGEETGTRKVEVSGMPGGGAGGAGGATESQLLTRLAALNDDKQNLINKITPLARYDNTYKIIAGSVSKINSAIESGNYNQALGIYNAAKSEIDAIPVKERGINYNTALNDLENYLNVAKQVIHINSQVYKTPTSSPAPTNEEEIMDKIINQIR